MRDALHALWREPRAPEPPARVWRDWVLVGLLVPAALLAGIVQDDVIWRPVAFLMAVVLPFGLLWRRTHPFPVVAVTFGAIIVVDTARFVVGGGGTVGLYVMVWILLLPYSLLRWGAGREVAGGLVLIVTTGALGVAGDWTGLVDALVGGLVLLFPALLGGSVRTWTSSRSREIGQVRLLEREQLARELHDTVAHHVSAIVVRAQAGRVVAAHRPEAALEALVVIEDEASRTLGEMRTMVRVLRDGEEPELSPQRGVDDIRLFADRPPGEPQVQVELTGDLADLGPAMGPAIYRIAQESVTNAVRHARHATRIDVLVAADADVVRLTVRDDGSTASTTRGTGGYGLVGMAERATLLGGSLEAGPGPERGWMVTAVLPRVRSGR